MSSFTIYHLGKWLENGACHSIEGVARWVWEGETTIPFSLGGWQRAEIRIRTQIFIF